MKTIIFVLMFAISGFAQSDKARVDLIKKETASLRAVVQDAISSLAPNAETLESPKATYLEGYGVVVTLYVKLGPRPGNPFNGFKSPQEIKAGAEKGRKDLQEKMEALLKQRSGTMESVSTNESVSIVIYLLPIPADLPELPAQLILTAKKQDPTTVTLREF